MYEMQGFQAVAFVPLIIWWILVAIPFAIGAWHVAGRMGRSRALWVILTVVPIVNVFFYVYAMFAVVLYVLDRLNQVAPPRPQA